MNNEFGKLKKWPNSTGPRSGPRLQPSGVAACPTSRAQRPKGGPTGKAQLEDERPVAACASRRASSCPSWSLRMAVIGQESGETRRGPYFKHRRVTGNTPDKVVGPRSHHGGGAVGRRWRSGGTMTSDGDERLGDR
jgi:hypothetical protein